MVWYDKVAWSEGLFLCPQLFQQQERYLERHAHLRCEPLGSLFWGFSALRLDNSALAVGRVEITHARGLWPDGLSFDVPGSSPPPAALAVGPAQLESTVVLAVPARIAQAEEVCFGVDGPPIEAPRAEAARVPAAGARYDVFDAELRDVNSVGMGARSVQLLHQRLRLFVEAEVPDGWLSLPLARVAAVHADGAIELDANHLPPLNVIAASDVLMRWLGELQAHVGQRAAQLAQLLVGDSRVHGGDMVDYLLLQVLSAHEARLGHLIALRQVAPERVHELLCALAAELAALVRAETRRPGALAGYDHRDPGPGFRALLHELRELLHRVVRRGAEALALQPHSHGMYVASVDPSLLGEFASLVLGARSDLALDAFAQQFASQAKVAPADRLAELVRLHLPGIALRALPGPPRQIPVQADHVYFQLEPGGPLWEHMRAHGGIGLHMAVEFPGLQVRLWGVR